MQFLRLLASSGIAFLVMSGIAMAQETTSRVFMGLEYIEDSNTVLTPGTNWSIKLEYPVGTKVRLRLVEVTTANKNSFESSRRAYFRNTLDKDQLAAIGVTDTSEVSATLQYVDADMGIQFFSLDAHRGCIISDRGKVFHVCGLAALTSGNRLLDEITVSLNKRSFEILANGNSDKMADIDQWTVEKSQAIAGLFSAIPHPDARLIVQKILDASNLDDAQISVVQSLRSQVEAFSAEYGQ